MMDTLSLILSADITVYLVFKHAISLEKNPLVGRIAINISIICQKWIFRVRGPTLGESWEVILLA